MKIVGPSALGAAGFAVVIALYAAPQPARAFLGGGGGGCPGCATEHTQLMNKMQLIQQVEISMRQLQQTMINTAHLPAQVWGNTRRELDQVNRLIRTARSLAYTATHLDEEFARKYGDYDNYVANGLDQTKMAAKYQQWSADTNASIRTTLGALGMQARQFDDEETLLNELQSMSQSASGRMQAIQAGNQLLAQSIRQTQKLRQLMMLQMQMQANHLQMQQDKEAAYSANLRRFTKSKPVNMTDGRRY